MNLTKLLIITKKNQKYNNKIPSDFITYAEFISIVSELIFIENKEEARRHNFDGLYYNPND